MNTAQIVVVSVIVLLACGAIIGFIWYNKWIDRKMSEGCQGQFEAVISIIVVSYLIVMVAVGIAMLLAYFFGGAVILTAIMIPVKFNFTWWQIILYGGGLGIAFMLLRYAWGRFLEKWGTPGDDVLELRN